MLRDCTLCDQKEDPRWGLLTKEGDYYPLCDGCAPDFRDEEDCRNVANRCRAMGPPLGNSVTIPKFGWNEKP